MGGRKEHARGWGKGRTRFLGTSNEARDISIEIGKAGSSAPSRHRRNDVRHSPPALVPFGNPLPGEILSRERTTTALSFYIYCPTTNTFCLQIIRSTVYPYTIMSTSSQTPTAARPLPADGWR